MKCILFGIFLLVLQVYFTSDLYVLTPLASNWGKGGAECTTWVGIKAPVSLSYLYCI